MAAGIHRVLSAAQLQACAHQRYLGGAHIGIFVPMCDWLVEVTVKDFKKGQARLMQKMETKEMKSLGSKIKIHHGLYVTRNTANVLMGAKFTNVLCQLSLIALYLSTHLPNWLSNCDLFPCMISFAVLLGL